MQRKRIVQSGADAAALQKLAHAIALWHTHDEQMIDGATPRRLGDDSHVRRRGQEFPVTGSDGSASLIPLLKVAQLDSKQRRLESVQSPVVAFHVVVVLLRL